MIQLQTAWEAADRLESPQRSSGNPGFLWGLLESGWGFYASCREDRTPLSLGISRQMYNWSPVCLRIQEEKPLPQNLPFFFYSLERQQLKQGRRADTGLLLSFLLKLEHSLEGRSQLRTDVTAQNKVSHHGTMSSSMGLTWEAFWPSPTYTAHSLSRPALDREEALLEAAVLNPHLTFFVP